MNNKLWQYISQIPQKTATALVGRPETDYGSIDLSGVDTTTPEFKENMPAVDIKIGKNPRVGGLLPDIAAGYRENSINPLAFSNLQEKITPEGQKKGAGYRFGEFAGTAARLLDNPLVRGAIAYGLSDRMGDRNPLIQGVTAAVGTQQNRMKDQMYRQALAERKIDTSGIRGWIGDDTFKYLLEDQQVRDNAAYRNAYLKAQETNQAIANQIALDKLNYTKYQDAQQNAIANRRLNIEEAQANKPKLLSDSQVKDLKGTTDFLTSLENIETRYNNPKYDSMFGIKGDIRRNNPLSRYDAEASLFKQDVEILRQRYAKLLEGGRLSDSDRAFYQKALFNPNVSRADFLEAVKRMKKTLQQDYNNALSMYAKQGKDITGFELTPTMQTQATTNEGWAF